jgi:predicted O-linked N-acetylglucosamine transferase (SPINDLY family)
MPTTFFQPDKNIDGQEKSNLQLLLQADPISIHTLFTLGKLCLEQESLKESWNYLTQVLELQPTHADAWFYSGTICRLRGQVSAAIAFSYRAYELDPQHSAAHSQALLCMQLLPDFTQTQILAEHLRWANAHALFENIPAHYNNDLDPNRKLKIGYLLDDQASNLISAFFEPFLSHYDPDRFEIYCYVSGAGQDETTLKLAEYSVSWQSISTLLPAEIAAIIQQDTIDILVDLAGHDDHNNMLVLTRKPAPIQVTYLGYPCTTGMAQVDYRLTDVWLDPPDQPLFASEELLHLSKGFLCYQPSEDAPDLGVPPSQKRGHITFGSINTLEKTCEATIALWSQILLAVPNSKLLLLAPVLQEVEVREYYYVRFEQHGVGKDRLILLSQESGRFSIYSEVDIILDTFPSNGMLSSCDALWMGVPVITLVGSQQSSRIGASILNAANLGDLIASSPESYIQKAIELAENTELLAALRKYLRDQLLKSALLRGKDLTQEVEALYRKIWHLWCSQRESHQNYKKTDRHVAKIEWQLINLARSVQWQTLSTLCAPEYADLHHNLGLMWWHLGKPSEAEHFYQCALQNRPDFPEALCNLGMALFAQNKIEESIEPNQKALQLKPDFDIAYQNIGQSLKLLERFTEALEYLQKSVELNPKLSQSYHQIGQIYQLQGRASEAINYYRQLVALDPDTQIGLCWIMHYVSECSPQEHFEQLKHCGRMQSQNAPLTTLHLNDHHPTRRLRVGYLSPDLHAHSVTSFFEPLLTAHNQEAVETFCYAEEFDPDHVTARLQGIANHWRSTCGLSDEALNLMIRDDQIDILVDLAGYTTNSRIRVMAYKPAPVQVTYLGYPNTTGMTQIDYRMVDAWTDPPHQPSFCTETLVRLENGFLCYMPPTDTPENGPPPALEYDFVTFGSFNILAKLSIPAARLWAKILGAVPNSRLFLKSPAFVLPSTKEYWKAFFEKEGIHPSRLELLGWCKDRATHLSLYNRVDIALDPFPYNGTTTTCEALWMGVPVITLAGNSHVSRVGVSLLSTLQLENLIAHSEQEYLDIAVQLAQDRERITLFRETIRHWMSASPLCDSEAFAYKVEAAYRQMWRNWCEKG